MAGLFLKEYYLFRSMYKTFLLTIGLFLIFALLGIYDASVLSGYIVVLLSLIPVSLFSLDETARWEKYAPATSAGRQGVVKAKYLFSLAVCGFSFLFIMGVNLLLFAVGQLNSPIGDLLSSALPYPCLGLTLNSILLPLIFKFGVQKSRIVIGVATGVCFFIIALLQAAAIFAGQFPTSHTSPVIAALIPLAALLLFALSHGISQRIYARQEL